MTTSAVQTDNSQVIASEIARQLGGNKFIAMTGAKHHCIYRKDGNMGIAFHIMRNSAKIKYCAIVITKDDTYIMDFLTSKGKYDPLEVVKTVEGVNANDLRKNFTEVTGLDTHL